MMKKIQPNLTKLPRSSTQKDPNFIKRQKNFRKTKTIKDDVPDALYNSNSAIIQSQKLTSVRKNKLRMSCLEQNIDLPDTLLGIDEYKEIKIFKDKHVTRKLRASLLKEDLPDVLEPVNEIIASHLPKPYNEESKNPEINQDDYNENEFIKEKSDEEKNNEEKKEGEIIEEENINEEKKDKEIIEEEQKEPEKKDKEIIEEENNIEEKKDGEIIEEEQRNQRKKKGKIL